jgi:hypothetical protein
MKEQASATIGQVDMKLPFVFLEQRDQLCVEVVAAVYDRDQCTRIKQRALHADTSLEPLDVRTCDDSMRGRAD